MQPFETKQLSTEPDVQAPDGSDVRILLGLRGGGMAHFELAPGEVAQAVTHKTVEEIWYFVTGHGQMWRKTDTQEEIVDVKPGICVTIPLGTHFQFRCSGTEPLAAVAVTMPPWPGEDEAIFVAGPWTPTTDV